MKRIGVTGASGFLGQALVAKLVERGDFVRAFFRWPDKARVPQGVEVRRLDLTQARIADIAVELAGLDAVCHLSGESVAGRWTPEKKQLIHDSRELTTRNLVTAMWECAQRPTVLVCASATGYYGSRGDEPLSEDMTAGSDFLARVCIDWEREAEVAEEFGTRVVRLRQGIVLGRQGGALPAMLPAFRFGAGGPLGSGHQWWPWIHLDDAIQMWVFALDREDLSGPINSVAPDPATNARFSQALGHALRRPSLAPAPSFALRLLLGEFTDSLLSSQLVLPAIAEDAQFQWKHPRLESALLDLLDPDGGRRARTSRYEISQTIPADINRTFDFFTDVSNLSTITPPELRFRITSQQPATLQRGAIVEHALAVRGIPIHWKTLITRWEPGVRFVDYQVRGPYLLWRHQHDFEPGSGGTLVRDTVEYALPAAPLSDPALPLVREDVRRIFDYRRTRLQSIFGMTRAAS